MVGAMLDHCRALGWKRSLGFGAGLGDWARRLGVRREVARDNLRGAFPERGEAEREEILREHYREVGRVAAEYARLAELVLAPPGEAIAEVQGLEHLEAARREGRGLILLSGHFGNFELWAAHLGRFYPMDFVVRELRNPGVEALIDRERAATGVGRIHTDMGMRRVYESLRANRCVPMLGDQDARRHGVFVDFLGRKASTTLGPARIALATGAPLMMVFIVRRPDGRHVITIEPRLEAGDRHDPGAALRLTRLHVARLEHWVRARPAAWFWLHRRWKTRPPEAAA